MNIQNTAYSSIRQNRESQESGEDAESDCSRFTVRRRDDTFFGCFKISPQAISCKVERPQSPFSRKAFCWDFDANTVEVGSESPPHVGPLDDLSAGGLHYEIKMTMDR